MPPPQSRPAGSPVRVLLASLAGTSIEYFDFYIFGTAAVLVFPHLFFPEEEPASAILLSLATFSIAFFARPLGAALFGHFGDRIGRKATLVASLLTMGLSTSLIGVLPGYASVGVAGSALLVILRFGQGVGLGGEWGGAVLLAAEYAPPGRRGWYAMFPMLGAPIGFLLSTASFLALADGLSPADFADWGWRVPFLASFILVALGLYVRLNLAETPEFRKAVEAEARVSVPMFAILQHHKRGLALGTVMAICCFVLFYLTTVFCLSWATTKLGYSRKDFLLIQMIGVIFFGLSIPAAALLADRFGRRQVLILTMVAIGLFGLGFQPLFESGPAGAVGLMILGLSLMGFAFGPLGAALACVFPVSVRYTGASMTFNLAGILGASLAPYAATELASRYGLAAVGYYLLGAAAVSLSGMLLSRDRDVSL